MLVIYVGIIYPCNFQPYYLKIYHCVTTALINALIIQWVTVRTVAGIVLV